MENWIKICTVRLVKFPELCYYFQYVRVQFVRLAARLLHKKNYVVLGGQYEGAAVRTMDSPRSDGVLKNRRAEMALPLRLRDGALRSGAQPALWWVAELRLSAERACKGGGQRRSDRKSLR